MFGVYCLLSVICWAFYILLKKGGGWNGYFGNDQYWAANGQQAHQICPMGENYHYFIAMSRWWRPLNQLHSTLCVLSPLYTFDWVSCRCAFLSNYQQCICSQLTWLPLETKSPNDPFIGFSELDLALCSICNMYSNTVHLCILSKECLTCCTQNWYNFSFFFLCKLQYFYRHCCVGSRLNTGFTWFYMIWSETKYFHSHKLLKLNSKLTCICKAQSALQPLPYSPIHTLIAEAAMHGVYLQFRAS